MTNGDMAVNYIEWAIGSLKEARSALKREDYARTVRRCQESLELAVKSVLRLFTIEYPRDHDVSDALDRITDKVTGRQRTMLYKARILLPELAAKRGPAMYGLEREGRPSSTLFTCQEAHALFGEVKEVVDCCRAIFRRLAP